MEAIIDKIISTTWLFMTVTMISLTLAGVFAFMRPSKHVWLNYVMATLFSAIFIYILIFGTRGAYGYAVEFISADTNSKTLALVEKHEVGDGDGGTYTSYRLYLLDLATGKRLVRKSLNYPEILAITDDGVINFEHERVVKYNLVDGSEIKEWSKEIGFEQYPELNVGINDIGRDTRIHNGRENAYLKITALDGHEYMLDIETEKLVAGAIPNESKSEPYYFWFENVSGEIKKFGRSDRSNTQSISYDGSFLEPDILIHDTDRNLVIVKHFTTLKKDVALITAFTYDLKKLWQLNQADLLVADEYQEEAPLGAFTAVNDHLILTFGGMVICIELSSGKEIWRNRL